MNPAKPRSCRICKQEFFNSKRRSSLCESCENKGLKGSRTPRKFETLGIKSKKARLIKEIGNICQDCGISSWQGQPVPIQLDHIDGDTSNNERSNLRLLCPNCHALTPTYAGRNVGKAVDVSRAEGRKKYYKYVDSQVGLAPASKTGNV